MKTAVLILAAVLALSSAQSAVRAKHPSTGARIYYVCGEAASGSSLTLTCPDGYSISNTDFSSGNRLLIQDFFATGTLHPTSCADYADNSAKIDSNYTDIDNPIRFDCHVDCPAVFNACAGKKTCTFTASSANCESGSACSPWARGATDQSCTRTASNCGTTKRLVARAFCVKNETHDDSAPVTSGAWVYDGVKGVDIDWQASTKCVGFRWGGFRDFESGIDYYDYAVGTAACTNPSSCNTATLGWRRLPAPSAEDNQNKLPDNTPVFRTFAECPFGRNGTSALQPGTRYFVHIRARNKSNKSSPSGGNMAVVSSDGFRVDAAYASPKGAVIDNAGARQFLDQYGAEFNVKLVKSGSNWTFAIAPAQSYRLPDGTVVAGKSAPEASDRQRNITVVRGMTYVFHVDPSKDGEADYNDRGYGEHPFYLSTHATGVDGRGARANYVSTTCHQDLINDSNQEVFYSGGDKDGHWKYDLVFKPNSWTGYSTNDMVWYQDCNHALRGGIINIVDPYYDGTTLQKWQGTSTAV